LKGWYGENGEGGRMNNCDKIILDLCGGTGAWSKPYAEAGYDVRVITLPEYDVRTYQPLENVYGILAAPPCNDFARQKVNRDLDAGFEIVIACLKIIWACVPLHFWALENPATGMLDRFLGKPALIFQPIDYGDAWSKSTALWGYFKKPIPRPIPFTFDDKARQKRWHIHKFPSAKEYPGLNRSDRRAITPPGFARAFYEANK